MEEVCCLVFGVWCLVFGVWCLVFGVWCLEISALRALREIKKFNSLRFRKGGDSFPYFLLLVSYSLFPLRALLLCALCFFARFA